MVHILNKENIKQIIGKQMEKDVPQGEQVSGSGHLGHVDCILDSYDNPRKVSEGWEITYKYIVSITTEFTVYPDNPPREDGYEKTIIVDEMGDYVKTVGSRIISSNWGYCEPLDSDADCVKSGNDNEVPVQRVVDLKTGKDITGEYISERLVELGILADKIIQKAVNDVKADPLKLRRIYETSYWEIHERLGSGSIGPATAVAWGLMEEKKEKLADVLGIKTEDRVS